MSKGRLVRVDRSGAGRSGARRWNAVLVFVALALALGAWAGEPVGTPGPVPAFDPFAQSTVTQSIEVFEVEQVREAGGMVERRLAPAAELAAGDELRYVIRLRNDGPARIEAGRVQVQTPLPEGVRFLPGSAGGAGTLVEYALDGATFSPHVPDQPVVPDIVAPGATGVAEPEVPASASAPAQPPSALATGTGAKPAEPGPAAGEPAVNGPTAASGEAGAPVGGAAPDAELTIRWTYQLPLDPGAVTEVFFHVRLL